MNVDSQGSVQNYSCTTHKSDESPAAYEYRAKFLDHMNCWCSIKGFRGCICLWLNFSHPKSSPIFLSTWLPASQSLHPILNVDMCPHMCPHIPLSTQQQNTNTHTHRPNITTLNASQAFIIRTVILHEKQSNLHWASSV
jgi:hypothetical protein